MIVACILPHARIHVAQLVMPSRTNFNDKLTSSLSMDNSLRNSLTIKMSQVVNEVGILEQERSAWSDSLRCSGDVYRGTPAGGGILFLPKPCTETNNITMKLSAFCSFLPRDILVHHGNNKGIQRHMYTPMNYHGHGIRDAKRGLLCHCTSHT